MFKMDIPIETGCEMEKKEDQTEVQTVFVPSLADTLCGQRQTGHEMERTEDINRGPNFFRP